jgi:hypothetical protein
MNTYDEIVGFDYTSVEEWQKFVKEQILPLHKAISKIIKLRGHLEHLIGGDLPNLIKDNTSVRQILLGGVDEKGEYKPNSLAMLYKETLGVLINPKEWVSLCKQPGIDASDYIKCNFSDNAFLHFFKDIKEITEKLLSLIKIDGQEVGEDEIKEILESPEKIVNELKEIYARLISISANYSYHTFFILNTRCIPKYYMEQAYPKMKEKFEEVAEFLGLEPKFIPDVKEGKIKRISLWGHRENGFADLMDRLNKTIWNHFDEKEFGNPYFFREGLKLLFHDVPNLRGNYIEKVERTLGSWKLENLRIYGGEPIDLHEWDVEYYLEVNNALIIRYFNNYSVNYYKHVNRRIELSLFEVIDKMAPALFVRLANLEVKDKYLVYDGNYSGRI